MKLPLDEGIDFSDVPEQSLKTARWTRLRPRPQSLPADSVAIHGNGVHMDYSEIELRVLAHYATPPFNLLILRYIDKGLAYTAAYGSMDPVYQRVDEEGCGSFIGAALAEMENDDDY